MDGLQPMVAIAGAVVIWVATAVRSRARPGGGGRSATGAALGTVWAAFFGSRDGVVALAEHSATFRAHFGDAAATWLDVQNAIAPFVLVSAVITLVSRGVAVAGLLLRPSRPATAPAGQVPTP